MRELAVLRALEPEQDEVLEHLVGIGLGRAMTVLGDMVGTRLRARPPRMRFVSTHDEQAVFHDDFDDPWTGVVSALHGSLGADTAVASPSSTAHWFHSRLGPAPTGRDPGRVRMEATTHEIGSVVLGSTLEGLRPLLPEPRRFSHPESVADLPRWWGRTAGSAVGGVVAELVIEDGDSELRFDFLLLLGPRALDHLLLATERHVRESCG